MDHQQTPHDDAWWLQTPHWDRMPPEVAMQVDQSFKLAQIVFGHLHGLTFSTHRAQFAASSLMIAYDHAFSVGVLVANECRSAAFSLARSILEAFLRGTWIAHIADDVQLERFAKGHPSPGLGEMVQLLKCVPTYEGDQLEQMLAAHKHDLHGFAHGNIRQVSRWLGAERIEAQHSDADTLKLLRWSAFLMSMSAMEIQQLAGKDGIELLTAVRPFMPGVPDVR